jgi:hypothetical protein
VWLVRIDGRLLQVITSACLAYCACIAKLEHPSHRIYHPCILKQKPTTYSFISMHAQRSEGNPHFRKTNQELIIVAKTTTHTNTHELVASSSFSERGISLSYFDWLMLLRSWRFHVYWYGHIIFIVISYDVSATPHQASLQCPVVQCRTPHPPEVVKENVYQFTFPRLNMYTV